jgi:nucleoid DNA-binding protein
MPTKPSAAPSRTAAARPAPTAGQSGNPATIAGRPMSRNDVFSHIGKHTGLQRKQVGGVFAVLEDLIRNQLGKKGPGVFQIHGLLKLKVIRKPATKAKAGVNPFTGEAMTFKAKPARNVVKALPLKGLKEMV